jgi:cytochrome c oxidase cbb3-type subunit 3
MRCQFLMATALWVLLVATASTLWAQVRPPTLWRGAGPTPCVGSDGGIYQFPPAPQLVAVRVGHLFDSKTGTVLTKQEVLLSGERITEVGPEAQVKIPAGARVIEQLTGTAATTLALSVDGTQLAYVLGSSQRIYVRAFDTLEAEPEGALSSPFFSLDGQRTGSFEDHQYSSAEIQAGSRLYAAQCTLCHGQNGDGVAGVNLPRQQFRRASSDDDIRNTITTGAAAAGMPGFRLQPAELDALVAFIRSGFDISATPFTVGDAGRGKAVYDGRGACATCHRVAGKGARTAPDLSGIGAIRQPAAIQRSLLEPSRGMMPINRPVRIVTRDGRIIRGRRLNEDTATVQLIDEAERLVSLSKSDIRELELGTTSGMPSFAGKLTREELADLLAYLLSLRGQ